ncbi:MAG: YihY/virulence factor BrkB family protein [Gemmatimonadaceae bacterium]
MVIRGYYVGTLLKGAFKGIGEDNVLGLAAQAAYNAFFSIFPFFLFAAPLISLIGDKQKTFTWLMTQLATVVPSEAIDLVRGVIKDVVFSKNAPGLISVGAVLALWSGSAVFGALMSTLNSAYNVRETRPWWKRVLIQLVSVLAMGVLVGIASIVMLAGPELAQGIGARLGIDRQLVLAWTILQYPIAIIMIVAAFYYVYRFLPNLKQRSSQILVGSVVATILWFLVTLAFRVYVTDFSSYNKTYGTIGAVIVLLTWMYLTMLVLLAAGELNSELHAGTGALDFTGQIVTTGNPGRSSMDLRITPASARILPVSSAPISTDPSSPRRARQR